MKNEDNLPIQLRGWNWGAFFFTWIWGVRFRSYKTFLIFVPFVNIIIWFMLGFKGNKWAWQNNHWDTIEQFKKSQKNWSIAALIVFLSMPVFAGVMYMTATHFVEEHAVSEMAFRELEHSQSFKENIGSPYAIDLTYGSKKQSGNLSGSTEMQYTVEGANGEGIVDIKAELNNNIWNLTCLEVTYNPENEVEVILPC